MDRMAPSAHDHASLRDRLVNVLAAHRASHRLGLRGVLSTTDLLRRRRATLAELQLLATMPGLDHACRASCQEAIAEVSAS